MKDELSDEAIDNLLVIDKLRIEIIRLKVEIRILKDTLDRYKSVITQLVEIVQDRGIDNA